MHCGDVVNMSYRSLTVFADVTGQGNISQFISISSICFIEEERQLQIFTTIFPAEYQSILHLTTSPIRSCVISDWYIRSYILRLEC